MNKRLHVCRQKWWLALAALAWCGCAAALNPDLTIKELHHTAWGPSQGAPLGGTVALAQTTDGYLWIAGPSGLFRFDGLTFERVELPRDPKLSSLSLFSVFAPRGGGLWVGFTFGGVAFLKGGHWQVFSAADGLPESSPWQFAETPDGTLWVSTGRAFARFDGTRWTTVGSESGLLASDASILFVDSQGTLWAGGGASLFFLRSGEHEFHNQPVAVPAPWTDISMAESSAGTVWLDVGTALVPVARNPPAGRPSSSSRGGIVFDHDGALWDATDGLHRIAHPEHPTTVPVHPLDIADTYIDIDGLTSREVYALLVDREGNVWVGTTHGLDRFSEPRLNAPLQSTENLKVFPQIGKMGVVPADDAGGLWVTNGNDAVVRYQNGRMSAPILSQKVDSLIRAADGTVWFGGREALWHERQGQLDPVAPPGGDHDTQALAEDKSGALWVSILGDGVFRLRGGSWTQYSGTTLPQGPAITIVCDRHGRLWFSYPGGSVTVLDGERVRTYGVADGMRIGNVLANYPGPVDQWLGGEFGLARFDGEQFHNVLSAPELQLEGITGIVETMGGDLWLNDRAGIVHIAASELQRSRRDPTYRVHGETLGAFDGVVGSSAMVRPLPTAIETPDGKLWFATTSGIYGIDPARRVRNRVPPPVLIRALTVAGHSIEATPGLTLPVYTATVRFDYMGLSLTAPQNVRYRYRLDGADTDWHELTAGRQALYTNLRPGHYAFRVIAANNDGVWNESGATLPFVIPAAFVQTGWFIVLCVVGGAVAVWALVRVRVRQVANGIRRRLEERMEERLNERTRIARVLHDSLLQGFQGLMFRLQAVRQLLPPGDAAKSLDSAMQLGDQAICEGRDAVQNLRSSSFDDRDLATSLRALGTELGAGIDPASMPQYRMIVEGTPRDLTVVVCDETCRIVREAVSNAYQHAKARHIETEVTFADADLTIRVRDDGIGVDPQILARGQRTGHWGIPGMRERSDSFGGHLHVWSEINAGTEIELRIPAHVAYAQPPVSMSSRLRSFLTAVVQGKLRRLT